MIIILYVLSSTLPINVVHSEMTYIKKTHFPTAIHDVSKIY